MTVVSQLPKPLHQKLLYYAAVWRCPPDDILTLLIERSTLSDRDVITDTEVYQVLSSTSMRSFPLAWFEAAMESDRAAVIVQALEAEKHGGEPWLT